MNRTITSSVSGVVTERIAGPYEGYYVASYVVPFEQGYIAFASICIEHPQDVWQCNPVDRVAGSPAASPAAALDAVWLMASKVIDRMPVFEFAVRDGADSFGRSRESKARS
jgi:hypothetical protein